VTPDRRDNFAFQATEMLRFAQENTTMAAATDLGKEKSGESDVYENAIIQGLA
jgi:hypothetical protein